MVSNTIIISKHEKGICNYTMHVLLASLQLYYVIYVWKTPEIVKITEKLLVKTTFFLASKVILR